MGSTQLERVRDCSGQHNAYNASIKNLKRKSQVANGKRQKAKGNSKRQTIIMFILIILRDVSFLLSGKGNKVTESPATTIIHRVYESPCGIITTYATPGPPSL